jgi:hypothetical protein
MTTYGAPRPAGSVIVPVMQIRGMCVRMRLRLMLVSVSMPRPGGESHVHVSVVAVVVPVLVRVAHGFMCVLMGVIRCEHQGDARGHE